MVHIPFFGKKKEAPRPAVPASSRVKDLSSHGYSEPEIIKTLRAEGYAPIEVDRALKTTMKTVASDEMMPPLPGDIEEPKMGLDEEFPLKKSSAPTQRGFDWMEAGSPSQERGVELPPIPGAEPFGIPKEEETLGMPRSRIPKLPSAPSSDEEEKKKIEELVESVVEEKWNLLEKDLGEINGKFEAFDTRIKNLEEDVKRLQELRKTEKDEIRSSLSAYRESVAEMTMKIDSIEKAMKDTMTPMLQTLRSMSEAMKSVKKK